MDGPIVFLGGTWMPMDTSRNFESQLEPIPHGRPVVLTTEQYKQLLINHGVKPEEAEKQALDVVHVK